MKKAGLRAIYAGKRTSIPGKGHKKYPYLLRGKHIWLPNQVWATDITYIKLKGGNVYLVAIIDLYSRKILSWRVSNTMDAEFCVSALEEAIALWGEPAIFNTDQGSQFTSDAFIGALESRGIRVSMDGKNRALDKNFRRALLAVAEVRGHLPQGLPDDVRAEARAPALRRVLQRRTLSCVPGLRHTERDLC